MQTIYKVFLILFIIFIAANLYFFQWDLGFWHEENTKFIMSIGAALVGILLVYVLNTWSKLSAKK